MRRSFISGCLLTVVLAAACHKPVAATAVSYADSAFFAKGADIGWLSEMEAAGIPFYDQDGKVTDCMQLLKSKGINAIRLRVWVDPKNGWCGKDDVVKQAVRAMKAGMKIMIDFHYSDNWADPGKQNKPGAWMAYTPAQLTDAVYQHTKTVLLALSANGVTPDWVQVGNETNDGMLWEDGRASKHPDQFAAMLNAGAKAVKEVNSRSKVIVHISNGYDNTLFRWMFDKLVANKVNWEVIAMSLYPSVNNWPVRNTQCLANMQDMVARYGKEIMISEVGMEVNQPLVCRQFLDDIIAKTRSLPDHKGLGVFYWEPECYNNWQGYSMGAFDNRGRPSPALDAFKD